MGEVMTMATGGSVHRIEDGGVVLVGNGGQGRF